MAQHERVEQRKVERAIDILNEDPNLTPAQACERAGGASIDLLFKQIKTNHDKSRAEMFKIPLEVIQQQAGSAITIIEGTDWRNPALLRASWVELATCMVAIKSHISEIEGLASTYLEGDDASLTASRR